ncbi:STAS domain-containing protein [Porticoccaceae bacterium]|nr:STAS domain-containing protein [SAR92 clade bacterium H231]MDA7816343.1 STAS domain-containing protein [Porticoccaceae bacterium]MDA8885694.1 STAS domain-containing protein [Porticoccaceae bacterium]MDA9559884.1 STAS domain-containing protein [Porticoccaceae bacterium]MDB2319326.1 STAS domain-containing protein [Porticoccaceae bacterium]
MSTGKILVSDKDGNYLIKFSGDVRVNLCGSLNHHMAAIFGSTDVQHVVIDMLEAECVDSTTLGLIAKLALHCRKEYNINMQLFCQNPSILRTLDCMSFDEIIDICQEVPDIDADLHAIETVNSDIDEVRRQVLEAHKLLTQLSPDSSKEFTDLIRALESGS